MVASFCGTDSDPGSSRCAKYAYYGALSGGSGGASTGVRPLAIQPSVMAAEGGRHPAVMRQIRRMRVLVVLVVAGAGLLAARARRTTIAAAAPAFIRTGGEGGGSEVSRIGVQEGSESRSREPPPSPQQLLSSSPKLKLRATNEYGEYDKASLKMYGLDMVIEPFRSTTVTAEGMLEDSPAHMYVWRLRFADQEGGAQNSGTVGDAWNCTTGEPQVTVELERPGTAYFLSVESVDENGRVITEGNSKVSCKYVRREIRDLTDRDREAFLDAMQIWYTVPTDVGKARYGPSFSNYQVITAYHNADVENFCYHIGLQFLTSHAAFDLTMERYLQMIDPSVSLPTWDFMIDSASLGHEWYNSVVFDNDWFGSAFGSPENGYAISESRFGNVSTIYDPDGTLVDSRISPYHNAYGYVTSAYNYQDLPRMSRTSSFCGVPSHAVLSTAETFVDCFDGGYTTLSGWESCMETMVHGDIHGLLGGAFSCNTDMSAFSEAHPEYSAGLLSFVLEYMTFTFWPTNSFIPQANVCQTSCSTGQDERFCGCTCMIDAFAIDDEQVYAYMEDFMTSASVKFQGDQYISCDGDVRFPYGFMQDQTRLSDEENLLLMRYLIKIGCEPGAVGSMTTLASPLDPLFYMLHSMFEKALHIVWLSPKYRDSFSMNWAEDGICPGSGYTDELPFTESLLGLGEGTAFMTNERLLDLLHPSNPAVPYIYEDFAKWGTSDLEQWDPYTAKNEGFPPPSEKKGERRGRE